MAIFHLSAKPISRAAGRSSTAAAAYRSGEKIVDERTGEIHDYTRKLGVLDSEIILPGGGTADRAEFWNGIEKHHKRGDAVLSREVEVSLPTELTKKERRALAVGFARELADRYGVAADVALHDPRTVTDKDLEKEPGQYYEIDPATGRRHNGNWHAHIMLSACHVSPTGDLGKKAVELDPIHCQRAKIENMADRERVRWAHLANSALERAGQDARIDHRTLEAQGITDRLPGVHLGPTGAGMAARGEVSEIEARARKKVAEFMARMQAEAAIQAAAERAQLDVIELMRQLVEANAEAAQPKLRTRNELLAELEPVQTELAKHEKIISEITLRLPAAQPRAQVDAAKSALASMGKRSDKAQAKAARIQDDLGKLGWWRPFAKARLRKALPVAQQAASQLAKRLVACRLVSEAQPRDRLESVIADSKAALAALQQQAQPLQQQLATFEAARDAQWVADRAQAQEAAKAARKADLKAQEAILARYEAAHRAQQLAPGYEPEEVEDQAMRPRG